MLFFYTIYAQADQASLTWDASTSPNIGGYRLYYGQASRNYTANVDVGTQTSYTIATLQAGITYYFAVTAYDSTRTTESGFSNEISLTIDNPVSSTVNFSASPTSGTIPLLVTFTDTSTGNIAAWSWNFGDDTTGTTRTVVKTYSNPGTYTVSLTVNGSDTAIKTNYISVTAAPPVANFSASSTTGTAPLAVTFTNSSTGTVTGWSWDFADGSPISTAQNPPTHTYTTAGTYTVSLTATNSVGSNTKTQTISVSSGGGSGGGGGGGAKGNTGLVAAYSFEEASGTTVVDASGQRNHGVIAGATRVTEGRFGKALAFDGVRNWVTVADAPSLDLSTGMTLEAWVYPTAYLTGWRTVLLKERPNDLVYSLQANSPANLPSAGACIGGGDQNWFGTQPVVPNQWTHLAATYDGTTERLYINGGEVVNHLQSGPIQASAGVLRIGGNSIWGQFFKGRIDEVRIYNRALSATEILTDMKTAVSTSSPPVPLLGSQAIGVTTASNPQGMVEAFQTTASVTGIATSLSVYVDAGSTATTLIVGLYTDKQGHPGTLIAQGALNSPKAGTWNPVSLPAASVMAGSAYWIALLSPRGILQFRDHVGGATQPSETSAQTTLTTFLPDRWTTGTISSGGPLSGYGAGY